MFSLKALRNCSYELHLNVPGFKLNILLKVKGGRFDISDLKLSEELHPLL